MGSIITISVLAGGLLVVFLTLMAERLAGNASSVTAANREKSSGSIRLDFEHPDGLAKNSFGATLPAISAFKDRWHDGGIQLRGDRQLFFRYCVGPASLGKVPVMVSASLGGSGWVTQVEEIGLERPEATLVFQNGLKVVARWSRSSEPENSSGQVIVGRGTGASPEQSAREPDEKMTWLFDEHPPLAEARPGGGIPHRRLRRTHPPPMPRSQPRGNSSRPKRRSPMPSNTWISKWR
jgi:hypothetical protein